MDPVLVVLQESQLKRSHIDNVCELLDAVEARDVYTAFEILLKLQKYLEETQSWSFKLLNSHDFDGPGNQFELNLATMVAERCTKLLSLMARWDVQALQRKVRTLPRFSDWAMVLTSLVLRIGATSSTVELNLRLYLSKATLVRIHCELSLEVEEDSSSPLVHKYRSFVRELLVELEGATSVQEGEKLFKAVSDIRYMFRSYREGIKGEGVGGAEGTGSTTSGSRSSSGSATGSSSTSTSSGSSTSTSSGPSSGSSTVSSSISTGPLSSSVLGAFERARTHQMLTALIEKPQPPAAPLQSRLDAQTRFANGPFKIYHPKGGVARQTQPSTANIATTSLMQAMRTGKWGGQ